MGVEPVKPDLVRGVGLACWAQGDALPAGVRRAGCASAAASAAGGCCRNFNYCFAARKTAAAAMASPSWRTGCQRRTHPQQPGTRSPD